MEGLLTEKKNGHSILVKVQDVVFGGDYPIIISGPCAIESYDILSEICKKLKKSGVHILRGGAFKPRTSPYDFQGLGKEGLAILKAVGQENKMPVVTEVMDPRELNEAIEYADMIQVGSRNMYNYTLLKEIEVMVYDQYPHITPALPENITFIHSEELQLMYPELTPRERENKAAEKFGAIFVIGIGAQLTNGEKHDGRAPDYDDWSSLNSDGFQGLNGDIILWNEVLGCAFELSSMGIRVDKEALIKQLDLSGCPERKELEFHKALLDGKLPLSIGGGIGQSRLCMFFLKKAHIGEVQASIWPEEQFDLCYKNNIFLL